MRSFTTADLNKQVGAVTDAARRGPVVAPTTAQTVRIPPGGEPRADERAELMASTLEEEALLWALDGDSVNNFVLFAQCEHGVDGERALALIRTLGQSGLVRAFTHAHATGAEQDLEPQDLSSALLAEEPYVLLTKTDRTLPRLNELKAAIPAT